MLTDQTPLPEAGVLRAGETEEFERQLAALRKRLLADFPDVAESTIDEICTREGARMAAARIQQYRLLLVEKHARAELRQAWAS